MNIEIELKFPVGAGKTASVQALARALAHRPVEVIVTCNMRELARQYEAHAPTLRTMVRMYANANLKLNDLLTIVAPSAADHVAVLAEVNTICQRMHDLEAAQARLLESFSVAVPCFTHRDAVLNWRQQL